jgi:type I restriction enzyme S subunit
MVQPSQIRTYYPAESAVFLKTNAQFGGLSNMAPGFPIFINGVRIRTSEALYQACRFPRRPEVQRQIIDDPSPMTAKMRSKPFLAYTRPDWDAARVRIMRWSVRVKLAQNWQAFSEVLLSTGDMPIVEKKVRRKDFWGATEQPDGTLVGMNVLGRLLMELREQLKGGEAESLRFVEPLPIPEFLLFGQPIEAVQAAPNAHNPGWSTQQPVNTVVTSPPCNPQPSLFERPMITEMNSAPATPASPSGVSPSAPVPFPHYRDSGLPWLGEIPEHWELLRSGSVFQETTDVGHSALELLSIKAKVGIVRQSSTGRKIRASDDRSAYKRILPGYLGYNLMNAFFGGIGVSRYEGILSPAYAVAKPKFAVEAKYFHYLYERNRLYFDRFKKIPVPLPPTGEQRRIAEFLDAHGRLTARLIRIKRRLIGLLNEQKQAIINQAVTRGLNPNVPMKPTGIDWMPEVPTHWQTTHLGSKIKLINGYPFDSKLFSNDGTGHPLIRIRDIFREDTVVTYAGEFVEEAAVQTGDILVGMDGDFNVARWKGATALLNQRVCCIRPKENLDEAYLTALLAFPLKWINDQTFSTTVKHLSSSDIKRLRFPVPPIEEQWEISAWLSAEIATLDRTIDRVQREIQLVREYRERLTADVATGKLDVRHIEIAAPADEPIADEDDALEEELEGDDTEVLEGADADD